VERWRRPCLVANRATLPQKGPPPFRNVANSCELTETTKPMELSIFRVVHCKWVGESVGGLGSWGSRVARAGLQVHLAQTEARRPRTLQRYLAHKKPPPSPLGPSQGPRHSPTVRS